MGRKKVQNLLLLLLFNRLPPDITDGQGLVKNNFRVLQFLYILYNHWRETIEERIVAKKNKIAVGDGWGAIMVMSRSLPAAAAPAAAVEAAPLVAAREWVPGSGSGSTGTAPRENQCGVRWFGLPCFPIFDE